MKPTRLFSFKVASLIPMLLLAYTNFSHANVDISQVPLLINTQVPGNLALVPSVEYPTVTSRANLDSTYSPTGQYVGIFDNRKCYEYIDHNTEAERHFSPTRETPNGVCSVDKEWSGNFLNWAVTQTIDPFRIELTGGYRVRDTTTETWLQKARYPNHGGMGVSKISNDQNMVEGATAISGRANVSVDTQKIGNKMRFRASTSSPGSSGTRYNGDKVTSDSTTYELSVRVKVCVEGLLEPNCKQYPNGNWKPEGLIQQYAREIRYSAFGYLNHSITQRDGGVLRARQKYVGPEMYIPGTGWVSNPNKEWDPNTGILVPNPDAADADATSTAWALTGSNKIANSGVINYINKFGELHSGILKSHDPVSELLYTAYRYFANLGNVPAYSNPDTNDTAEKVTRADYFPVITNWDDPVQYECQANVILGIGDTNTHRDKNLPGNTSAAYRSDEPTMPPEVANDTTINVVTETKTVGDLEGISDITTRVPFNGNANSAFMAGIAYFMHTADIRPDLPGNQHVTTHWVDVMENQDMKEISRNQYWLAAKYGGFRKDNFDRNNPQPLALTDWNTNDEQVTVNRTLRRPDNYYPANDAQRMSESLQRAFANIISEVQSSSASIAANSSRLDTDSLVYQARFNSGDWSGELMAFALNSDGEMSSSPRWRASNLLNARDWTARKVLTKPTTGSTLVNLQDNLGSLTADQANYLRGDRSKERQNGGSFRNRTYILGDIVNSNPAFSGKQSFGYQVLPGGEGTSYPTYVHGKRTRTPVVYVGSNAGMLHAFHAETGAELFAYVPGLVKNSLGVVSSQSYEHRYFVDGSPVVTDAYLNGSWKTVLVGSLGRGGRGLFALDVTNPANPSLLWEFSHASLGEGVEEVSVVRMPGATGKWVVLAGNGYNTAAHRSSLLVIDLSTGTLSQEVLAGTGSAAATNGMAAVTAISSQAGKREADTAYAGDLQGNLWKFVVDGTSWKLAPDQEPFFQAVFESLPQPITSKPEVTRNADGDILVVFGTGKYLEAGDIDHEPDVSVVHSAYGVIDRAGTEETITRDDLLEQEITHEGLFDDRPVRVLSSNSVDDELGWYIDLISPVHGEQGERIVVRPVVRGELVVFTTMVTTGNACAGGGSSWLMAVSKETGGAYVDGVFDLDGDGNINDDDFIVIDGVSYPVSGLGSQAGILTRPNAIGGQSGLDHLYTTGSSGDTEKISLRGSTANLGRQSWRQVR